MSSPNKKQKIGDGPAASPAAQQRGDERGQPSSGQGATGDELATLKATVEQQSKSMDSMRAEMDRMQGEMKRMREEMKSMRGEMAGAAMVRGALVSAVCGRGAAGGGGGKRLGGGRDGGEPAWQDEEEGLRTKLSEAFGAAGLGLFSTVNKKYDSIDAHVSQLERERKEREEKGDTAGKSVGKEIKFMSKNWFYKWMERKTNRPLGEMKTMILESYISAAVKQTTYDI